MYIYIYTCIFVLTTYIIGSYGSSRVAGDKFELHIDPAEEKLFLGLEARARDFVQRERQKLTCFENLGPVVTPRQVKVLVEVTNT